MYMDGEGLSSVENFLFFLGFLEVELVFDTISLWEAKFVHVTARFPLHKGCWRHLVPPVPLNLIANYV